MKMKAEHWVNHNGKWYRPGEEYEVDIPAAEPEKAKEEPTQEQPVKRSRKRKTEE